MGPELAVALGLAALGAEILARVGRRRARLRAWREAAGAAGLTGVRETNDLFEASLSGRANQLHVRLDEYRAGRRGCGTRLLVGGLGGGDLFLRREDLRTALGKGLLRVGEIVIGSPAFDAQVYVHGEEATVLAILDAETRRQVARLLAGEILVEDEPVGVRASVGGGEIRVEVEDRRAAKASFAGVLCSVLKLARRLRSPPDIPVRLARNLRRDPEAGFRLNTLRTLVREYPKDPATRRALLAARHDASVEVRLHAAVALGEAGRQTLLALLADEDANDECGERAVRALAEHLPEDVAVALLRRADDPRRAATSVACLESLAERSSATTERIALALLEDAAPPVQAAAARALGRVGTAAAIPELGVASRSGPRALARAARQAVAEIQSRLPGAGAGQLTLATSESGALSLADQAGGLTLADVARRDPDPDD